MVEPLYNPLSTISLAKALLLVRLRPEPPPPFPPCEPTTPALISDQTLARRTPDLFEPTAPVPFSTFLRRNNEEYRAARERLEFCPRPKCDRTPGPRPAPARPDVISAPAATRPPRTAIQQTAKVKTAYHQQILSPTGRMVDIFI